MADTEGTDFLVLVRRRTTTPTTADRVAQEMAQCDPDYGESTLTVTAVPLAVPERPAEPGTQDPLSVHEAWAERVVETEQETLQMVGTVVQAALSAAGVQIGAENPLVDGNYFIGGEAPNGTPISGSLNVTP